MPISPQTREALERLRPRLRSVHFEFIKRRMDIPAQDQCAYSANDPIDRVIEGVGNGFAAGKECAGLPNVQAAYRQMMASAAAAEWAYPEGRFAGRGLVMAGGGDYFAPLFVSIRMIRHVGCQLPIEVFHLGSREMLPWQRKLLEPLGVKTIDANSIDAPIRPAGGWPLKPFAVLNSSFEEVLFLDADCYPVRDPSFLFDSPQLADTGAIFWPDRAIYENQPTAFEALGLPAGITRPIESGQFVVNKRRAWKPMNLAWWMNQPQNAPYYYALFHGDKESYRFAWQFLGTRMSMPELEYEVSMPAMLGHDFDGRWLFVHRCCGKMTLANRNVFSTNASESTRNDRLPHEAKAWAFLEELREARRGFLQTITASPPTGDCGCSKK